MLHFIGILTPREDYPEGDDRQKPFFGPELQPHQGRAGQAERQRGRPALPARSGRQRMLFANLLSPPFPLSAGSRAAV